MTHPPPYRCLRILSHQLPTIRKQSYRGASNMSRYNISTESPFESQIGYSRAVVSGSWVLVSGTTGYVPHQAPSYSPSTSPKLQLISLNKLSYNYKTNTISPSLTVQTSQALQNISSALNEAGASISDVVRVRYILPDAKEFPQTWPVLKRWFGNVRPAATMLCAGLMQEEMRIEIEVLARKGRAKERAIL